VANLWVNTTASQGTAGLPIYLWTRMDYPELVLKRHGESDAVKRFEAVYSPELVDVVFTDYEMAAGKGQPQARAA